MKLAPDANHDNQQSYVGFDIKDNIYAGAAGVVDWEHAYVAKRRGEPQPAPGEEPDNLTGLAISGGGIRSSTFALGVLQALARRGWLEKFDYLSTVSGGGYIGSALTWFLHKTDCGLGPEDFPFGTRRHNREVAGKLLAGGDRDKSSVLRWLRQHAGYLTPGDGIDIASFVAVVLRGTFLSLLVYFPMLVIIMLALLWLSANVFPQGTALGALGDFSLLVVLATGGTALLLLASIGYSIGTWRSEPPGDARRSAFWYWIRRHYEIWAGRMLIAVCALAVVITLPFVTRVLDHWFGFATSGGGTLIAGISTALGVASGVGAFIKTQRVPRGLLVGVGAVLLGYGLLLLGYQSADYLLSNPHVLLIGWPVRNWLVIAALAVVSLIVGYLANLNYISIHRYYRDRLMEAFMPSPKIITGNEDSPTGPAVEANSAHLSEFLDSKNPRGPYHIINTNLVLVESEIPKFRGRGGDNFILTPGYCGSNATGWARTADWMGGRMTLATAMAISGAAANPHTGVGGQGDTRGQALSFLMALLNISMGYWARKPTLQYPGQARWKAVLRSPIPNFLKPGIWDLISLQKLNERSDFLMLSDGGHFENLAFYELIRRRCRVILVCDGAADPDFSFDDLANALEKVRTDFGVAIDLNSESLQPLVPRNKRDDSVGVGQEADVVRARFSERGYVRATIHYPDDTEGTLIYLKTSFPHGLPADLYGYRLAHPAFPDEPTADQFFDEKQFEAYRELGYQLASTMMDSKAMRKDARVGKIFTLGKTSVRGKKRS